MAADLKFIELCARQIARVAKDDKIVVEKSTCRFVRGYQKYFRQYWKWCSVSDSF
jgi:UDP-glucose 6-dehydrogenase